MKVRTEWKVAFGSFMRHSLSGSKIICYYNKFKSFNVNLTEILHQYYQQIYKETGEQIEGI